MEVRVVVFVGAAMGLLDADLLAKGAPKVVVVRVWYWMTRLGVEMGGGVPVDVVGGVEGVGGMRVDGGVEVGA